MKKSLVIFSFVFLLSATIFVSGAGSSTQDDTTATQVDDTNLAVIDARCNEPASVRDRVKCRLVSARAAKPVAINSIEESCRNLGADSKAECLRFQRAASPCYDMPADAKSMCLRRNVGLGAGQLNRFAPEDRRKYAALLLYELQERVEAKQEQGAITDDEAADLIASIVDIKEALLNNTPIDQVKEMMVAFKTQYQTAMEASS